MAPDLRDLLDDAVSRPPAESHNVESVVRRAARSRVRFRAVRASAAALAVLLVTGLGAAAVRLETGHERITEPQSPIHGKVVHPSDATPAVGGRDYDTFASYTARDLSKGNDRQYDGVARTGEVIVSDPVLRQPGNKLSEYDRYGLMEPGSAKVAWLPLPPDATFSSDEAPSGPRVTDVTKDTVVWTPGTPTRSWKVELYHRADHTWTTLTIPVQRLPNEAPDAGGNYARLADGRVWFERDEVSETRRLYSVDAEGDGSPIHYEGRVGDWAVDDAHLVWTSRHNAPADTYSVRDLASGTTRTFATGSGARCQQLALSLSGERIDLTEYCGTRHGVRDDRAHVVSLTGQQVVTVQGDGVDASSLGEEFLVVNSFGNGDGQPAGESGAYVYDFASSQLRRVSTGAGTSGSAVSAGGRTFLWATSVNGLKGQAMYAATWK